MRSEQAFSKVRARLAPALIRKSSFFLRAHTTEFEKCNAELTTDAFYCALEADLTLNRKQRRKHINWHLTNWWCSCRSEVQIITAVYAPLELKSKFTMHVRRATMKAMREESALERELLTFWTGWIYCWLVVKSIVVDVGSKAGVRVSRLSFLESRVNLVEIQGRESSERLLGERRERKG